MNNDFKAILEALLLQKMTIPEAEAMAQVIIFQFDLLMRNEMIKRIQQLSHEEILKMGYVKKEE